METLLRFIVFWGLNTLALWLASLLFSGVSFTGPEALLWAGLAFGVVNTLIKPVLFVLTLPITIVTLGFFILVLNALILFGVAWLVPGFSVGSFWQTFFAALFISFFGMLVNARISVRRLP